MSQSKTIARSAEIDLLRAIAIIMMMTYHMGYDLHVFYGWDIDLFGRTWTALQRVTASIFLLLTGICFVISWQRSGSWKKYVWRGLRILVYGMVISVATYIFDPSSYVRFGILHLIGVTTLFLPLLVPLRLWSGILGIALIIGGAGWGIHATIDSEWLLPLGITPPRFHTVDYFPLLPWSGVILLGVSLGWVYSKDPARYTVISLEQYPGLSTAVRAISVHSLLIYMLHQPIFLLTLTVLQKVNETIFG